MLDFQPVPLPPPANVNATVAIQANPLNPQSRVGQSNVTSALSGAGLNLLNAEAEVTNAEIEMKNAEAQRQANTIQPSQLELAAERAKQARARRDFVRRELETQLRLLELEVQAANARLESTKQSLSMIIDQHKRGAASQEELSKSRSETEQAEIQLQKAKTLLELLRVSTGPGSENDVTKPATKVGR